MALAKSRDFLEPGVISRLANVPLCARLPMLGNVSGRHRSPHRGSSIEFAEYRKYVPGDDTRRLDWRAYARSDRYYIKEFEADTNLRLCLVVDTSGSMAYGGPTLTKLQYAQRIAASLGYLAGRQGDAVGLICASQQVVRDIPPRRNAAHLRNVFDALADAKATGETGLIATLHHVAEKVPQRALVVLISDLFVEPNGLADCFQHLRFRKHDVAVFHLLENAELEFQFDRPIRFVDLEGGSPVLAEPAMIRRQYQAALADYLQGIDQAVREAAIDYHRVSIGEHYGEVLARFLLGRQARRARR